MPVTLTPEEESKDRLFRRIAELAEEMVVAHGKDFAMGALILAARWIAENRQNGVPPDEPPERVKAH
ncbi:MAG: hypothetical protein U1E17_07180 [Geminicoccaceae bacterium]